MDNYIEINNPADAKVGDIVDVMFYAPIDFQKGEKYPIEGKVGDHFLFIDDKGRTNKFNRRSDFLTKNCVRRKVEKMSNYEVIDGEEVQEWDYIEVDQNTCRATLTGGKLYRIVDVTVKGALLIKDDTGSLLKISRYSSLNGNSKFKRKISEEGELPNKETKRKPLGLTPKYTHDEQRLQDIDHAITRYVEAGEDVPDEWMEERRQLLKEVKK